MEVARIVGHTIIETIPSPTGTGVVVSSVAPGSGDAMGSGGAVVVSGESFAGTPTVLFGGNPATSVVVQGPTALTCTAPAGTTGKVAVSVDGASLANAFIYRGANYTRPSLPSTSTDRYVSSAAGGAGTGTSGDPWTLAQMKAALANSTRYYLQGDFGAGSFIDFTGKTAIIVTQWVGQPQAILRGDNTGNQYPALFLNNASYIVVEDVDVIHTGTGSSAVEARSANHCQLVGMTVTGSNVRFGTSAVSGASDNWIYGVDVSTVGSRSTNTGDGFWFQNGAHRNTVILCSATACGHSALSISYQASGEATCDDNVIAYCTFTNTWAGGVILNGKANRTIVECCDISDSATDPGGFDPGTESGIQVQGTNNIIRYNRIWGCDEQGISLQSYTFAGFTQPCTGNHVHNNTIYGCGAMPLHLFAAVTPNTYHANNIVESNLAWGNHTKGASEAGGYYSGAYRMIWAYTVTAGHVWTGGTIGGNIFRNNGIARTASAEDFFLLARLSGDGGTMTYSLASFESTFSGCANNVVGTDPSFTNAAGDDFTLGASSYARNIGYATAGVDYHGGAPDVGAFERA